MLNQHIYIYISVSYGFLLAQWLGGSKIAGDQGDQGVQSQAVWFWLDDKYGDIVSKMCSQLLLIWLYMVVPCCTNHQQTINC